MSDSVKSSSSASLLGTVASAYLLNVTGRAADICWLLLLFTVLSVQEVAVFAFASAAAAFFSMALDAGLNQTLLREFSAGHLTLRQGARLALQVRVVLLLAVVALAFCWVQLFGGQAHLVEATVLACGVQVWLLVEMFCQQWLKANQRQTTANLLATAEPLLKLSAVAVLLVGNDTVTAAQFFIAQNIYHVLLVVACVWACRLRPAAAATALPTSPSATTILQASAWFALIGIATVLQNRLDWLLIARFTDEIAMANYSLVNRAYEVLMVLIGTGATTLLPLLCRDSSERDQDDLRLFQKAVLALGVLAAGLATVALPVLCGWLWGDKYAEAMWMFRVLMPIAAVSTFIQLMYYQAVAGRAEKKLMFIVLASTGLQLVVNLLLVPLMGVAGAVVGMLTLALSNIAFYAWQRSTLQLPSMAQMGRLGAYAAIMTACWFAIPRLGGGVSVQIAAALSAWAVLTAGWLFLPGERSALKARFSTLRIAAVKSGAAS